jgi:CRP-like cAMP-binding protein
MYQGGSLRGSFLANLEPRLTDSIRQRAVVHHHPSGDTIVSETEGRWTGIVLSGMARVFLHTETGRQVTIRYAGGVTPSGSVHSLANSPFRPRQ